MVSVVEYFWYDDTIKCLLSNFLRLRITSVLRCKYVSLHPVLRHIQLLN
jgi:hypothetical protein